MFSRRLLSAVLLSALAAAALAADAERIVVPGRGLGGEARFTAAPERGEGSAFTVPLRIDVGRVTRDGKPVVLGAYVARVDFDPAAVDYIGVTAGSCEQFAQTPIATSPEQAKATGSMRLVGYHATADAPVGVVHVATLSFAEKRLAGAQTVKVTIESLASAMRPGLSAEELAIPLARRETPERRTPAPTNP